MSPAAISAIACALARITLHGQSYFNRGARTHTSRVLISSDAICEEVVAAGYEAGLKCEPGKRPDDFDPRLVEAWSIAYIEGKKTRLAILRRARDARMGVR